MILTLEDLININKQITEQYNQNSVLINRSNLESALSIQYFDYDNFNTISAKLFRNIIIAHGFQDANKRTAIIALGLINPPKCTNQELGNLAISIAEGKYKDDINELVSKLYFETTEQIEESFSQLNEVDKAKVITIVDERYHKSVEDLLDDINSNKFNDFDYVISEPINSFELMEKDMSNGSRRVIYRYFIDEDDGKILVYVDVK